MANIKDDKGYNQIFPPSAAMAIRTRRRSDFISDRIGGKKAGRVLEIGCGTGELAYYLSETTGYMVTGCDVCRPFTEEASTRWKRPGLDFETVDFMSKEAFPGREFDYVVGNGILHHLYYSLDESLSKIAGLLVPGGRMVFLEPNLLNPYCYLIFTNSFLRKKANLDPEEMAFSRKFIRKKLASAGFIEIEASYRDFLLPGTPERLVRPLILLGSLLEKMPLLRSWSQSIFITAIKP